MKMNTLERRILAMILAVVIFASNLTLGAAAEDGVYCGNEEHTHTEECYVNNAEPTVAETEPEETEPEVTEPEVTEPEVTEPETTELEVTEPEVTEPVVTESEVTEPVCTCGSESDTHSSECALYAPTFLELLLTTQTLKKLHDVMMANPEGIYALTAEELTALKTHAEELYAALTEPTQDEQDYYELITETVEVFLNEVQLENAVALEETAQKVLYFDLALGGVTIGNTCTGKVYVKKEGTLVETPISEPFDANTIYYVFQSIPNSEGEKLKGYVTQDENGGIVSVHYPEYSSVVLDGKPWGDHITGNHGTGIEKYSSVHEYGGVLQVERDWNSAAVQRKATTNKLIVSIAAQSCQVVLDDIWIKPASEFVHSTGVYGGLQITGATTTGTHVTLLLEGDNRIDHLHYNTSSVNTSSLTLDSAADAGSNTGTLTVIGAQDECGSITEYVGKIAQNTWNSAIGSGDGGTSVHNLVFMGGTIYAGSTPRDNCTAIGGGGNQQSTITIKGGRVTAVANTTGTAIGGGIGHRSAGGKGTIVIEGGCVYAYNYGQPAHATFHMNNTGLGISNTDDIWAANQVPGTAIGGGSSVKSDGAIGNIVIKGDAYVRAESLGGAAIGGGNSIKTKGGAAEKIEISGSARVEAYSLSKTDYYVKDAGAATQKNYSIISGSGLGGGSSYTSGVGGEAKVTISGSAQVSANAVGGGTSKYANGGRAEVVVNGSACRLVCEDNIGGGRSTSGNGGDASVTVYAGYLQSSAIGGGNSDTGNGGNIIGTEDAEGNLLPGIHFTGGTIRTGEIGGGTNTAGDVGYASALVEGGDIRGQFVMKASVQGNCSFTMTGGTIHDTKLLNPGSYVHTQKNGGAVYMDDPNGTAILMGTAKIETCDAENGGAVYMTAGTFTMSDAAEISSCSASINGGAVYLGSTSENKGSLIMSSGTIKANSATDGLGGAIYLAGGNATVSGGTIGTQEYPNTAKNGGGAYLAGGMLEVSGEGSFAYNTATENGGGAYLDGGTLTMTGGSFTNNAATNNGGGAYISGGDFELNGENAVITENKALNGAGIYLTGGEPKLLTGSMLSNEASGNGGGIYIDQQQVMLAPEGEVKITGNKAVDGAGIYIGGTTEKEASFAVKSDSTGIVEITGNTASGNGAGVCISNGLFTLDSEHITLQKNTAQNGGAVAVLSGDFTMSGGAIGGEDNGNTAQNGGAVYVNGGDAAISGGTISHNTAEVNGGGIAVNDGDVIMSGGSVSNNTAKSGSGGGMFVSSESSDLVSAIIYSGTVSNNTAAASGGAVGIRGSAQSNITVQIGVNEKHYDENGALTLGFKHGENDEYTHEFCPEIKNNQSLVSGGAFYITRMSNAVSETAKTVLNIYCLEETGNNCSGDLDINDVHLSDFLMVEGGNVSISTTDLAECDGTDHEHTGDDDDHGHAAVYGSVHVAGGTLDLYGSMLNPSFESPITIDLEKQEDHFHDHRLSPGHIKLSYYENFDFNGIVDSTRTAIDLKEGEEHTISDSLYKHVGYEIVGWNTKPDGEGTWYDSGVTYVFIEADTDPQKYQLEDGQKHQQGDLILYAIWEANGYTVHFDPNVPEGETYTGEEMPDQTFTYNTTAELNRNTYKRKGYFFVNWSYVDDAGQTLFKEDGEEVKNLTSVKGGTVVMKANWEKCVDHPGFVYTVVNESAQKAVMTQTCTRCGHTETATLTASDAVYDKLPHPANVVYSNDAAFTGVIAGPVYTGTKIDSTDPVKDPELVTNAGDYAATISVGDVKAEVKYQIAKAEQPAPTQKPVYTEPAQNSNILKVSPYEPAADNISSVSNLPVEFVARYYEDSQEISTDWARLTEEEGEYRDAEITLPAELKYYFVYARYAGDDNYHPSPEVMANGTFLFEGKISLSFDVAEGLVYFLKQNSAGELQIDVEVNPDFYLVGGKTKVDASDNGTVITVTKLENDIDFTIKKATSEELAQEVKVTVKIGDTGKRLTMDSKIQEKQVFGNLVGTEDPVISSDSAYTVFYAVKNYNTTAYEQPQLRFDPALPQGTTVILQSRGISKITYWSYTVGATEESSILLRKFTRMGGANDDTFCAADGTLNLQFVVDFSRAAAIEPGALDTTLVIPAVADGGADECKSKETITLAKTKFTLQHEKDSNLTQKLQYNFAPVVGQGETPPARYPASRWDNRDLAMLVTFSDLPSDATVYASVNGDKRTARPYENGKYIIPLGNSLSGQVELTLQSNMFPMEEITYPATCQLYASQSVADVAPLNGTVLSEDVRCGFTSSGKNMAVSVTERNDKHLFSAEDNITVTVDSVMPDNYKLKVQLEHQDQDKSYVNTNRKSEKSDNQYTFSLNGCVPGCYRVTAIVEREGGFVTMETYYYFIIQ